MNIFGLMVFITLIEDIVLTYDKHDYHGWEHDWIALIKRVLFNAIVE
jgi:hypothetical protein